MKKMLGGSFMRMLATLVASKLPKGFGFMILVFPFNGPGIANYISNGNREDMIKALEEQLKVMKGGSDFKTPEEN